MAVVAGSWQSKDLSMVIPSAWLSVFGKWLPIDILQDIVPFLEKDMPSYVFAACSSPCCHGSFFISRVCETRAQEGLAGFVCASVPYIACGRSSSFISQVIVTFLMLLAHRSKLLDACSQTWRVFYHCQSLPARTSNPHGKPKAAGSLDEILPYINSFAKEDVPDELLSVCQVSVLQLRSGRDSMSWVAAVAG